MWETIAIEMTINGYNVIGLQAKKFKPYKNMHIRI